MVSENGIMTILIQNIEKGGNLMANDYTTISKDGIKYLCGLVRDLASVSEGIDNINLADDKTFSNIYIKNLIDKCLEDANAEAEKLVGALTHLTCEETAIQPTLDNSEINVIYLYSADGNPPYQQFLKISEDKLVDLGSTSISLEDYIKAADVAKDYATKVELKAVTDKIGTTTLTTTDTTITGAIEEVKGIADAKVDKTSIVTALDDTVTDEQVASALLAKIELDKMNANLGKLDDSINGFKNVKIVSSLGSVNLKEIIQSEFPKLQNGRGMISMTDGTTLYCGTYIKYSNTQGSATFTNAEGTSYIWTIRGDTVTLQELATMDKIANSIIRESRFTLYNLNNVDNIEVAIDIAKSGYKPIAVSLYNAGTHLWFAQGIYFNDTICNLSLRGVTLSSATNAKCEVLVTYIKTS